MGLDHATAITEPVPLLRARRGSSRPIRVVAIITAFNEVAVIVLVVDDLIKQGVLVYLIDHCSTDRTVEAVKPYLHKGVIGIERFPEADGQASEAGFTWERVLKRKETL